MPGNGPRSTYFGKLLVIVFKHMEELQWFLVAMVSSGNRALSTWWHFYHIYKGQASVQELDADKLFACCNLCGKNIAAGNKAGKGGVKRHIKGQHPGQLKFMGAKHGGTLDVAIDSTIKKRKTRDGDLATLWTNSRLLMAERKEM
jgi:hypothetical protein